MSLITPEHHAAFDKLKNLPDDTHVVVFTVEQMRTMIEAIEGLDCQIQDLVQERDTVREQLAATEAQIATGRSLLVPALEVYKGKRDDYVLLDVIVDDRSVPVLTLGALRLAARGVAEGNENG